jgi:hypothetical protein
MRYRRVRVQPRRPQCRLHLRRHLVLVRQYLQALHQHPRQRARPLQEQHQGRDRHRIRVRRGEGLVQKLKQVNRELARQLASSLLLGRPRRLAGRQLPRCTRVDAQTIWARVSRVKLAPSEAEGGAPLRHHPCHPCLPRPKPRAKTRDAPAQPIFDRAHGYEQEQEIGLFVSIRG